MPQTQIIEFEGQQHEFPADFTDADIQKALSSHSPSPRARTPGFTPIDEGTPKGFTPIDEAPRSALPAGYKLDSPGGLPPGYTLDQASPAAAPAPALNRPTDPNVATMSAYTPDFWDRLRSSLPIIDRIQRGLSGPASSNLEALQKPAPGMSDERAIAPEQAMTQTERRAHPILTGAGEFAGGLSTPENTLLMLMMRGQLPAQLTRVTQGLFAGQMLKGAWDEIPDFRAALKRNDTAEAERIGTHVGLGALFGLGAAKRSAFDEPGLPGYEALRKRGQVIYDYARRAKSADDITNAGAGLYQQHIQPAIALLKGKLRDDGVTAIKGAIDADNVANIAGRGTISTAPAVLAATQAIEETGHALKPDTQATINKLINEPLLTLDDAVKLRSEIGNAASRVRTKDPKAYKILTAGYEALSSPMSDRVKELSGSTKPFDDYNTNFRAYYEHDKGVTGEMQKKINLPHESIPKLQQFASANLSQIKEQMRTKGLDPAVLDKAQEHARSLVSAFASMQGKASKGLYRLAMDSPSEALVPMSVYMASRGAGLYGLAPYLLATMVGRVTTNTAKMMEAGRIIRELGFKPEDYQTRTKVPPSTTYGYPNQDDLYKPPGGGASPAAPAGTPSGTPAVFERRGWR